MPHTHTETTGADLIATILTYDAATIASLPGNVLHSVDALSTSEKVTLCRQLFIRARHSSAAAASSIHSFIFRTVMEIKAAELTAFKVAFDDLGIDMYADFQTFAASLTKEQRAQLVSHIRVQAAIALEEWNAQRSALLAAHPHLPLPASLAEPWFPVKIYSDYDDTQQVKLFDHSFPNNTIYPGLRAFLLAAQGWVPASYLKPTNSINAQAEGASGGTPHAATGGAGTGLEHSLRTTERHLTADEVGTLAHSGGHASAGVHAEAHHPTSTPPPIVVAPVVDADTSAGAGLDAAAASGPDSDVHDSDDHDPTGGKRTPIEDAEPPEQADATPADGGIVVLPAGSTTIVVPAPVSTGGALASVVLTPSSATGGTAAIDPASRPSPATPAMHSPLYCPIGHTGISGLVYISARPAVMKGMTWKSSNELVRVRPQNILCGTILTSLTNKGMAERKTANYNDYHILCPEFRTLWLGDSGQGDIVVGVNMITQHDANVRALDAFYDSIDGAGDGSLAHTAGHKDGEGTSAAVSSPSAASHSSSSSSSGTLIGGGASPGHVFRESHASAAASGDSASASAPRKELFGFRRGVRSLYHRIVDHAPPTPSSQAASVVAEDVIAAGGALGGAGAVPTAPSPDSSAALPARAPAPLALIHDLRHSSQEPYNTNVERATHRAKGVHLFDSYVDAAVVAFQHGIVSEAGLQYVMHDAAEDLGKVTFRNDKQRAARMGEYNEACKRAQMEIEKARAAVAAMNAALATPVTPSSPAFSS